MRTTWVHIVGALLGMDLIFLIRILQYEKVNVSLLDALASSYNMFFSEGNFTRTLSAPTNHIRPQPCALEIEQLCVQEMADAKV